MKFDLQKTIQIIERTPAVLHTLLHGISDEWIYNNEGGDTWSPFDVVGHLIVCEKTDFIPRAKIILSNAEDKTLSPIDMNAHFVWGKGKTIANLLQEFEQLRKENIQQLLAFRLTDSDMGRTGIHPEIGRLTLRELLAKWVPHDLGHVSQIARVMAKQYGNEVGPFSTFLGILKQNRI